MHKFIGKKVIGSIVLFPTLTLLAGFGVLYDNAKAPSLPLPVAYEDAMVALGSATNQLHCVSATVATTFSPQGEWFFTFYSTNSQPKWVTVEFNGTTHVQNVLPPQ